MKALWLLSPLCSLTLLVAEAAEPPVSLAEDRALAKQLSTTLKAELTAALQVSPEDAIAVCSERAPAIAKTLGGREGVKVGRTALRVRNPDNRPLDWQREVLRDFARRARAGEKLDTLEYSAAAGEGEFAEHRYMKAIAMEPLCLTCHGAQLASSIKEAIDKRYPNDEATGFAVGELRGAVYVIRRPARDTGGTTALAP